MKRKFSRRDMLKLMGLTAAGAIVAACQPTTTGPAVPTDKPTDAPVAEATAVPVEGEPTEAPTEKPAVEPTVAEPTAEPVAGDVATGYYNLADFESQTGKKIEAFNQAPFFDAKVASGELPPVAERLPENPLVFRTLDHIGEYGGTLRFDAIVVDGDWHLRHINAANTIEMPPDSAFDVVSTVFGWPMQPGLFESFGMSEDGTVFTGTIRKGLKWSDGVPVTTDDVAFRINDVLLNLDLNPVAMPWLVWGNGTTEFTVIDERTYQLKFAAPYGSFINAEISMWPGTYYKVIYPAHWLKQYHKDYADEAMLLAAMQEAEYSTMDEWRTFFGNKLGLFGCDNTFMDTGGKQFPTVNPYIIVEDQGNGNYLLERNPYFYMIDQEGNQLPYIDKLQRTYLADSEMQDLSIIAGNTDMSCMSISIDSYPLYKENETKGNYVALPLSAWQDQIFIVIMNEWAGINPPQLESVGMVPPENPPDASAYDEGISQVYGDVRFRRAMSMALDRDVFNESLFLGLGRPAQVAPRPGTPFYKEGMEESWAAYDPEAAIALLEEMGMVVGADGWRVRPDGKPFAVKYDYFVITGASTPGSELVKRYWEEVGIKVDIRLVDVNTWFTNLAGNNINEVTTWWLAGSGANLLQNWFLGPTMITPLWNRYTTYKDQVDETDWELILKYVPEWQQEMQESRMALKAAVSYEDQIKYGTRMWELQAEWLACIGTVTDTKAPMILSADIGNVEMAVEKNYNFITMMEASDCWYFKNAARRA